MSRKPTGESSTATHTTLAVVFQVRDAALHVLLWQRGREPDRGAWALPGGVLAPTESLEDSVHRQLEVKVDVREVAHLEQLGTWGDPTRIPGVREIATAYLGLVRLGLDPAVPDDTAWHPVDGLPRTAFDHGAIVLAGRNRLRGKLSYSTVGFALAPESFTLAELRDIYTAALGHDVSATNLRRVLERRGVIVPTGTRRPSGRAGGRPAELFRFSSDRLAITDPFAALRPPGHSA